MTVTSRHRMIRSTFVLLVAASAALGVYLMKHPPAFLMQDMARPAHGLPTMEEIQAAIAAAEERRQRLLRPDPAGNDPALKERWGVEVIGLRQSAAGKMLDFRYRVIDVDKALPLFDSRFQPRLVTGTGVEMPVPRFPKVGALRTTNRGKNIKAGKIYNIMFANTGGYLKPGDKANVVIGDFKVENLTVR